MATREEIRIALDLIGMTNIMNELLDILSYQLKELDSDSGNPIMIMVPREPNRPPTVEELKTMATRTVRNLMEYRNMMRNYLQKIDLAMVGRGLNALGVNATVLQADIEAMKLVGDYILANGPAATTKTELLAIATYIDANVPKLKLLSRAWAL